MTDMRPATATSGDGLICPACRIDLIISERQGIEIDYCPKCRGIWLDRGELDKIIERSVGGGDGRSRYDVEAAQHSGHGHGRESGHGGNRGHGSRSGQHEDGQGYNRSRHGSFLSRLFD